VGRSTPAVFRLISKHLKASRTYQWLTVVLFGVVYLVVGVAFPNPSAADKNQFLWRLAAWVLCAVAFAIHIGLEHFRFQNSARRIAFRISVAVAVGGFGLAVAANVHALTRGTGNRVLLALALVLWPLITGVPAFLTAFVIAAALRWLKRNDRPTV
jgi:hypothetical protein